MALLQFQVYLFSCLTLTYGRCLLELIVVAETMQVWS